MLPIRKMTEKFARNKDVSDVLACVQADGLMGG